MNINPKNIKLLALGTGDSFTEVRNYSTFMLVVDSRRIHIDCPPYLFRMLRQYRERFRELSFVIDNVKEVIITHTHEDHCAGVEELGYMTIRNRPARPKLYTLPSIHKELWENSLLAGLRWRMRDKEFVKMGYEDYFTPVNLSLTKATDLGDFTLETRHAFHMPETIALKFRFGEYSFGYSADTGFNPDLFVWWKDCQFILHEVSFNPDVKWHCPLDNLLGLPDEIQKKIFLYHYPDDYVNHRIGHMHFAEEGHIYYPFRKKIHQSL
jgi:ribonuclease BN (tRNA processing enzyme)